MNMNISELDISRMFCMLVADLRLFYMKGESGSFPFFFGMGRDSVAIQRFKGCRLFFFFFKNKIGAFIRLTFKIR